MRCPRQPFLYSIHELCIPCTNQGAATITAGFGYPAFYAMYNVFCRIFTVIVMDKATGRMTKSGRVVHKVDGIMFVIVP